MNLQLQPIDGDYFTSAYFVVSTIIVLVMALASIWGEIDL